MTTETTPEPALNPDDLCVWDDGTGCPASELEDYMGHNYKRIPFGTPLWVSESERILWYGD